MVGVDLTNFTLFSFWLATAIMLASTVFFFVKEQMLVSNGEHQ